MERRNCIGGPEAEIAIRDRRIAELELEVAQLKTERRELCTAARVALETLLAVHGLGGVNTSEEVGTLRAALRLVAKGKESKHG